jgi:hypothetical protein
MGLTRIAPLVVQVGCAPVARQSRQSQATGSDSRRAGKSLEHAKLPAMSGEPQIHEIPILERMGYA